MTLPRVLAPDPLQFRRLDQPRRLLTASVLIVTAVALVAASVPSSWWTWSSVVEVDSRPFGPFLPGLLALCMVAGAARLARRGSVGTRLERPVSAVLGVAVAALCGNGLRQFLQLLVLRRGWWGTASVLDGPDRVLPLVWTYVAGIVLAVGFVAAVLAVADALLRGLLRRFERCARVLAVLGRGSDVASWLPTAQVLLFVVGHLVLGAALLESLGSIFPAAGGFPNPSGAQIVFLGMWPELSSLAVMQFGLGLWAAVELVRLVQAGSTPMPPHSHRSWVPKLMVAAAVIAGVVAMWRERHDLGPFALTLVAVIAVSVSVGLIAVHVSSAVGSPSGRPTTFRQVEAWFPQSAGDLASVVPILIAVGGALVWQWGQVVIRSVSAVVRFPGDAGSFWGYWQLVELAPGYHDLTVVDVVRPGLITAVVIAGLVVVDRRERSHTSWWAIPLFLGLTILSSRLDDPSTYLLLFVAFVAVAFLLAKVSDFDPEWWLPAVGVGIICAAAIGYLVTPDFPLTLLLAGSIALRFAWQAGDLNLELERPARVELTLALALLLSGLLLAERAALDAGYFAGQRFAALGQSVGLAFVAIPVAFALGTTEMWRRIDRSSAGSAELATGGVPPASAGTGTDQDDQRGPA